jgi:hypothetical protein
MLNNQCPQCFQVFSSSQRLKSHLERKTPCVIENNIQYEKFICNRCHKAFSRKFCLNRHLNENQCKLIQPLLSIKLKLKKNEDTELPIAKQMDSKEKDLILEILQKQQKQIDELREKPSINNQILQVVCIGNNDNYLDMLTERFSNFDRALEYIKDCALSSLTGDCKLIEKIYGQTNSEIPAIRFCGKHRDNVEYYNEKKEKVKDSKEVFGRRIANNLQNSYLKGVNYLINRNLENRMCPNKFLEEHDIQMWNQHIYQLSDACYQKKIVNNLNVSH